MTDKEFKRLSRAQLIDIIYQLQIKQEELIQENQRLKEALEDKRTHLRQAGNIAEASLAIHNVMQAAQAAASQYLEEIRAMHAEAKEEDLHNGEKGLVPPDTKAADAPEKAPKEKTPISYDISLEAILKEFGRNP